MPIRPRVLLADDHPAVLEAAGGLVRTEFDLIGTARTGTELLSQALRLNPDVIVLDLMMPGLGGIDAVAKLSELGCSAKVVFLTMHSDEEIVAACLDRGALGHVLKMHLKTHLIPAIRAALAGQTYVSESFDS
jgi:DNA-binding NarL/FixJ family response regulator